MKCYLITCMQGHHGRGRHAEITFAMMAQNLIEAQDKAKKNAKRKTFTRNFDGAGNYGRRIL